MYDAMDFFMFSFFMLVVAGILALLVSAGIDNDNERTTFNVLCTSQGGQVYHEVCLKDNRVVLDGRGK